MTCVVTNLDPELDVCKSKRSKTRQNITFAWLKHARPGTKSHAIIGAWSRDSYKNNVTVYRHNGHITDTT